MTPSASMNLGIFSRFCSLARNFKLYQGILSLLSAYVCVCVCACVFLIAEQNANGAGLC
jgi:hypothetical protein